MPDMDWGMASDGGGGLTDSGVTATDSSDPIELLRKRQKDKTAGEWNPEDNGLIPFSGQGGEGDALTGAGEPPKPPPSSATTQFQGSPAESVVKNFRPPGSTPLDLQQGYSNVLANRPATAPDVPGHHGWRKAADIAMGVGMGALTLNPLAGYNVYRHMADQPQEEANQQFDAETKQIQGSYDRSRQLATEDTTNNRYAQAASAAQQKNEILQQNADTATQKAGDTEKKLLNAIDPNSRYQDADGNWKARTYGGVVVDIAPKTPAKDANAVGGEFGYFVKAKEEKLGRPLKADEKITAMSEYKQQTADPVLRSLAISNAQLAQSLKEAQLSQQPKPEDAVDVAHMLVNHQLAPDQFSQLIGGFGAQAQSFKRMVLKEAIKADPNFNFEQASAEYQLVKAPQFQQKVRLLDHVSGMLPRILQNAEKLGNTNISALNKLLVGGQKQFGGVDIKTFLADRELVANELGTVLSAGTGSQTSDAKIEHARDLVSSSDSPSQIRATLEEVAPILASRRLSLTRGTYLEKQDPNNKANPKSGDQKTLPNGKTAQFDGMGWKLVAQPTAQPTPPPAAQPAAPAVPAARAPAAQPAAAPARAPAPPPPAASNAAPKPPPVPNDGAPHNFRNNKTGQVETWRMVQGMPVQVDGKGNPLPPVK
jgi:hypothetical protein